MKMLVTIRSAIVVRSLVRGIIVGKAKRKPRPSMPDWFWWGKTGAGSANKEITAISVRRTVNMQKSSERRSKKEDTPAQSEERGRNCN
jgi:hypothetical protein